uniref:Uncharacterized protein n=1 Tax=Romanomermis culicivorax TaxID=13658 RepID=A0A915LB91_ROMCU
MTEFRILVSHGDPAQEYLRMRQKVHALRVRNDLAVIGVAIEKRLNTSGRRLASVSMSRSALPALSASNSMSLSGIRISSALKPSEPCNEPPAMSLLVPG